MPRTALIRTQNLLSWTNIPLAWTGSAMTSFLATTDVFGGNKAARLIANATTAIHYVTNPITWAVGKRVTVSFIAKAGPGCNGAYISSGAGHVQPFTLNDSTKDASTGIYSQPTGTETTGSDQIAWTREMRDAAGNRNGWKRCFVSYIIGTDSNFRLGLAKPEIGTSFLGDASTTYIDVCFPQVNLGFGEFPITETSGGVISGTTHMRNEFLPGRNGLANSEDLGAAGWISPSSLYRNTNLLLDARGEQRATQIVPTTGAGSKYVTGNVVYETVQVGDTITGSIEVGSSAFPYIAISYDGGSTVMWINLTNNTTGTLNGFTATVTNLGVTNSGGSWRRIDFSRVVGAGGNIGLAIWPCDADASIIGTGDGSTINYVIGRTQLNKGGPFPYIRTNYPVIGDTVRVKAATRTSINRSQNYVADSNNFGAMAAQDMTSVLKNITDPFGVANNAWTAIANANGAVGHYLSFGVPPTVSPVTNSYFVKKTGSWDWAWFWSGAIGYSYFNMTTGAFGTNLHGFTAQNYGNGWYRLILPTNYSYPPAVVGLTNANGATAVAGDASTTSIGLFSYQSVNANWEGEPTVTTGTANKNGIRNLAL